MWDLIVSVPDHCLSFYLLSIFDAPTDSQFDPVSMNCSLFTGQIF